MTLVNTELLQPAGGPELADAGGLEAVRPPIKLVFVIDNMRLGGTELNAVRTAEHLDRSRFDLRVVCLTEEGPLSERYHDAGVPVEYMHLRSFYGPSMIRSGIAFVRMLRRERVDVVHAHDIYSNIFTAAWARAGGVHALITSRRWWTSLPNAKLRVGGRFAVSRSTAILANSSAVAELVASETPSAEGRIWTITNFVDEPAFVTPDPEERQRLRERWGAPADAVVIGCVARFDPLKDHAGLLRAFALLRERNERVYLVLIGDGDARPELEALIRDLNLDAHVHLAGEQRSRVNLHRGFDVSVLASTSEGFPNSLVEAMAAGRPVVATAVGGNCDAVVDRETGLLVTARRPDELATAMLRMVESEEFRMAAGSSGATRARERFHATSVLAALESMYEQLCGVVR